jgi:Cysteine-rich secretory protein family
VIRCQYGHDCHNTPQFKYSGQNINFEANTGGSANFEEIPNFIEQTINIWWNEKDMASQADIDNCCGSTNIPHFLEMSADRVNQVGCAISQYTDYQGKKSYMVCNYSFTIILSQQVYVSGAPASQCQSGPNPNYPSLCSVNEIVDPNKVF